MRKKIFIAGPYVSAIRPGYSVSSALSLRLENTLNAIQTGDTLFKLGYLPFIPHLFHFWNEEHTHSEVEWLRMDLEWLVVCDALFRMEGCSPNIEREVAKAHANNIPVFATIDRLIKELPPL